MLFEDTPVFGFEADQPTSPKLRVSKSVGDDHDHPMMKLMEEEEKENEGEVANPFKDNLA